MTKTKKRADRNMVNIEQRLKKEQVQPEKRFKQRHYTLKLCANLIFGTLLFCGIIVLSLFLIFKNATIKVDLPFDMHPFAVFLCIFLPFLLLITAFATIANASTRFSMKIEGMPAKQTTKLYRKTKLLCCLGNAMIPSIFLFMMIYPLFGIIWVQLSVASIFILVISILHFRLIRMIWKCPSCGKALPFSGGRGGFSIINYEFYPYCEVKIDGLI